MLTADRISCQGVFEPMHSAPKLPISDALAQTPRLGEPVLSVQTPCLEVKNWSEKIRSLLVHEDIQPLLKLSLEKSLRCLPEFPFPIQLLEGTVEVWTNWVAWSETNRDPPIARLVS